MDICRKRAPGIQHIWAHLSSIGSCRNYNKKCKRWNHACNIIIIMQHNMTFAQLFSFHFKLKFYHLTLIKKIIHMVIQWHVLYNISEIKAEKENQENEVIQRTSFLSKRRSTIMLLYRVLRTANTWSTNSTKSTVSFTAVQCSQKSAHPSTLYRQVSNTCNTW